jgi:hypothetical protein
MRCINSMKWAAIAFALFALPAAAQQSADDVLKAQLLTSPPAAVLDLAKRVSPRDHNVSIDVKFVHADLDGSGQFQYIVAFFFTAETSQDGFLRVFRQTATGLQVVGDEDGANASGGNSATLELIDVNGDGIPEVKVSGSGLSGAHSSFDLFFWTGSSLHCMTNSADTDDAYLADVDGDGQLEIIGPPYTDLSNFDPNQSFTGFGIYKAQGTDYQFERDSVLDPTGGLDAAGHIASLRFKTRLEPDRFSLEQVQRAVKRAGGDDEDAVHLTIRQLLDAANQPVSVDQIDPSTIVLDRNTHPLRVRLSRGESDDDDHERNDGSFLHAEFSRTAFLRRLPLQDLTKPLAKGDKVALNVTAKLKDGRTARGSMNVKVGGDGDSEDKHGD